MNNTRDSTRSIPQLLLWLGLTALALTAGAAHGDGEECVLHMGDVDVSYDRCIAETVRSTEVTVFYKFVGDNIDIGFTGELPDGGWLSIAFPDLGEDSMVPSVATIAYGSADTENFIGDYTMTEKSTSGVQIGNKQNFEEREVAYEDGVISARFVRPQTVDGIASLTPGTSVKTHLAKSQSLPESPDKVKQHQGIFTFTIDLMEGKGGLENVEGTDHTSKALKAHGAMMITAWIFLAPLGALLARLLSPRTDWWFALHRANQTIATLISLLAFILGLANGNRVQTGHFIFGIIVTILSVVMVPMSLFFRPDKSSPQRPTFNLTHRISATVLLVLATVNCFIGAGIHDWRSFTVATAVGFGVFFLLSVGVRVTNPQFGRKEVIDDVDHEGDM